MDRAVKYTLIDGAFVESLCRHYEEILDVPIFTDINWSTFCRERFRTIYYDALPVKKTNQTDDAFKELYEKKTRFFNQLRRTQDCHVRDGITRLRTSARSKTLAEVLEQKGVDTWIAVDAVRLSLEGSADIIEIWTSDADLYPVFEVMQDTRCLSRLRYLEGKAIEELVFSAGGASPVRLHDLVNELGVRGLSGYGLGGGSSSQDRDSSIEYMKLVPIEDFRLLGGNWGVYYFVVENRWFLVDLDAPNFNYRNSCHPLSLIEFLRDSGLEEPAKEIVNRLLNSARSMT